MNIYESSEDYLEAILIIQRRKGCVRSVDIAEELSVTKPGFSVAMKRLRENDYIQMDELGLISLLPKGQEIAERIYERHIFLTHWLISLGVDPEVARKDACKIEHDISPQTFDALKRHTSKAQ